MCLLFLQQLLQNASDALNKAERLREDLRSKEDEIESLKVTGEITCHNISQTFSNVIHTYNNFLSILVANLELDLQSSHDKLRKLTSNSDGKIEK